MDRFSLGKRVSLVSLGGWKQNYHYKAAWRILAFIYFDPVWALQCPPCQVIDLENTSMWIKP